MQLPIAGPTYSLTTQDLNYQRCVNFFPASPGPNGRGKASLLPTPGLNTLVELGDSPVRALMEGTNGSIYALSGSTVYKLTISADYRTATAQSIGTVTTIGSGTVSWDVNPTQIMFVDGAPTGGWIITTATDTLTQVSDADFTGGGTVTFMDSYFIYNTPNASTMYATDSNDGTSVSALTVATAEGRPDRLVAVMSDKRELWAFGEKSIEIWYNEGNATGFPFSRREGAFIDIGCAAKGSVVRADNTLYWLDNRGYVVRANGYSAEILSTEPISAAIQNYSIISDAFAYYTFDRGHMFYIITFPTAKKTWGYDITMNLWHERAYWDVDYGFVQHLASCHLRTSQLNLVGAFNSGKVYVMDHIYYDDGGEATHRLRHTQHFNKEFTQIGVDALEILMESGKAKVTGAGSNPVVTLRYSNDGGYTWSNHIDRESGKLGEYDKSIRWNRLGTAREWLFEFSFDAAVKTAIVDASVLISGGKDEHE